MLPLTTAKPTGDLVDERLLIYKVVNFGLANDAGRQRLHQAVAESTTLPPMPERLEVLQEPRQRSEL
jgi:hypothetical protein